MRSKLGEQTPLRVRGGKGKVGCVNVCQCVDVILSSEFASWSRGWGEEVKKKKDCQVAKFVSMMMMIDG